MGSISVITVPFFIECRVCGHGWQGTGLCCPHCSSVTVDVKSYTVRVFTTADAEEDDLMIESEFYRNEHTDSDGNTYLTPDNGCLDCFKGFNNDKEGYDGVHCPACGSENVLQSE